MYVVDGVASVVEAVVGGSLEDIVECMTCPSLESHSLCSASSPSAGQTSVVNVFHLAET